MALTETSIERDVRLPDGRRIVVRRVRPDDAAGLQALYGTLDQEDHYRRFFGVYRPQLAFFEELADIGSHGGGRLVAVEGSTEGAAQIVAEAGYSMLANGDGELAITVERRWRGWLGPYLLDALADAAAEAGVPNFEAEVLFVNRPMLALLSSRGAKVMEHTDWNVIRLLIGTGQRQPTWPGQHDRRRVLVEGPSGLWGTASRDVGGLQVLRCAGPRRGPHGCPALLGGRCLLAGGADEILMTHAIDDDDWARLRRAHGELHAGVLVTIQPPPPPTAATKP